MATQDMRIAIITPEFPPYTNWGGIATFTKNLATLLSTMKHEVHIITYDGSGVVQKTLKSNGLTIHYVSYKTSSKFFNICYYRIFGLVRVLINKFSPGLLAIIDWNIFSFLAFRQINKKYHFNILHSTTYHMPFLLISLIFKKIPLVLHAQGPNDYFYQILDTSSIIINRLKTKFEGWHMRTYAKKIVACSMNVRDRLLAKYPKLSGRVIYIPNFVDYQQFKNVATLNKKNIVFFGRLEHRKGADILVNVFVKLAKTRPNIKLYLIGERTSFFDNFWDLSKITPKIKNRIIFYPKIDDKNSLIELLKTLKGIAVFPSRYEPFGFVVAEAMALGFVVIASNKGGGKEIIHNTTDGYLITPSEKILTHTLVHCEKLTKTALNQISHNATDAIRATYSFKGIWGQISSLENSVL